jgi:hypothetical protein
MEGRKERKESKERNQRGNRRKGIEGKESEVRQERVRFRKRREGMRQWRPTSPAGFSRIQLHAASMLLNLFDAAAAC